MECLPVLLCEHLRMCHFRMTVTVSQILMLVLLTGSMYTCTLPMTNDSTRVELTSTC